MGSGRAGLIQGARSVPAALGFLRTNRSLWPFCVLPLLLNLALFAGAAGLFLAYLDPLSALISGFLEAPHPSAWYEWVWLGPLKLLAWAVRWILVVVFVFLVYFLFTVVGSVIAAPFLDLLSERVERLRTGQLASSELGLLGNALRAFLEEGKRVLFFLAVEAALLAVGLVPGMQPLSAIAAFAFAALFLPLDYCGYLLDRREVPFRTRRVWLWRHRRAFFGFGCTAFGTYLVPGLNFACLPLLVTAGTLLGLELGPPQPVTGVQSRT